MLKKGDDIPDISLNNQDKKKVNLKDFVGTPLVVFFYPKDHTKVCTKQVCGFRDQYEDFEELGAIVIGISQDNSSTHQSFIKRNRLPFELLTDQGLARKAFGVPKILGLLPARVTFVFDKKGILQYSFRSDFNAEDHIANSYEVIKSLES